MSEPQEATRRDFIRTAAVVGGGLLLASCSGAGGSLQPSPSAAKPGAGEDISPPEDLMREHGVLRRVLLVYGEALRRHDAGEPIPAAPLADAAAIVRTFIEDYHEKLEEDYLFPRFRKAGRLVDLVDVLLAQHVAGRRLTEVIAGVANPQALKDPAGNRVLVSALRPFIRMYSAHAAREDTDLFPAFRDVVSPAEFDELGDQFEDKENELFGDKGFEKTVARVAEIERALDIHDLKRFTPMA